MTFGSGAAAENIRAGANWWDYLIVTASNAAQAQGYREQLQIRRQIGLLSEVRQILVVPDPPGSRIGSGGSTLQCLLEVLRRQLGDALADSGPADWLQVLQQLRILILHAGGDSRRLPAYGACGKIFVPVPGTSDGALPATLFDRQIGIYLALPEPTDRRGQIVISSGDVLLRFDPREVKFSGTGLTGLACWASPEQASRHGVYVRAQAQSEQVELYLQKPSIEQQRRAGAVDAYGRSCLDVGLLQFDAAFAVKLLRLFGARLQKGQLQLAGPMGRAVMRWGLDFYREICCAMGRRASRQRHLASARASGSLWSESLLGRVFSTLCDQEFSVQVLSHCEFLDFGSTRGLLESGRRLLGQAVGARQGQLFVDVNNELTDEGAIRGGCGWVEGCRIRAGLRLGGENIVVGLDIDRPLAVPEKGCVDVTQGRDRTGRKVWFVRCYGIDDTFKTAVHDGAVFCGIPMTDWLAAVGASAEQVWPAGIAAGQRSLWNARLFPAVRQHRQYRQWLWMLDVTQASEQQKRAWRQADRYSLQELLEATESKAFFARRSAIRARNLAQCVGTLFRPESGCSAAELAYLATISADPQKWLDEITVEAYRHFLQGQAGDLRALVFPRIMHTLAGVVERLAGQRWKFRIGQLTSTKTDDDQRRRIRRWLGQLGLEQLGRGGPRHWCQRARAVAFEALGNAIVQSGLGETASVRSVLRSDEIVWARAAARLDVGGGWTDTPPYSLEHGGCVVNAAVNLNGQPPIQAYARVVREPVIRIRSIDQGQGLEIRRFEELLDYRQATSSFALAKAALVLSGFRPGPGRGKSLREVLSSFGGGIELTTLAAIPKGSGLGTSSIMGAVILAAIQRMMGRQLRGRELFHSVLRLEQALTTGGGWQDQIGGALGGVKMIVTEPGLVPDARIHYVCPEVLEPKCNGGQTLLYYTGITRLAKNILHQVVGRYLERDRATVATLRRIGQVAREVADALMQKDIERFGVLVGRAWELNKQLDPASSNEQIEELLSRIGPHIYGAKLLGAGGGGFLLMVCKSPQDAAEVRRMLEAEPPNPRARFFDFEVSTEGLAVTVC